MSDVIDFATREKVSNEEFQEVTISITVQAGGGVRTHVPEEVYAYAPEFFMGLELIKARMTDVMMHSFTEEMEP